MIDWLENTDTNLFLFLNGIHSPFWDKVMWFVSARLSWIPLYLLIIYLYIKKYKKETWLIVLATIVLITISDQSSVHLFKNIFERLRPCHNPEIQDLVHLVNNKCGGKFGFFSSHAANSFALATFTSFVFRKRIYTLLIIFWAAFLSYSRVYLGRHYPGDIIAGALFGLLVGYLIYLLFQRILKKTKPKSNS